MRIASICTELSAIWSALEIGGAASTATRSTRSGCADRPLERLHAAHRAADHGRPAVDADRVGERRCAATWSRIVRYGKRDPHSAPSGASEAGPVEPWQPPSMFGATTNHSAGSSALARRRPGPTTSRRSDARARPGPTRWLSPVSACSTSTALLRVGVELAPGLVGDRDGGERARRARASTSPIDDELPVARIVAGAPGTGCRGLRRQRAPIGLRDERRGHRVFGCLPVHVAPFSRYEERCYADVLRRSGALREVRARRSSRRRCDLARRRRSRPRGRRSGRRRSRGRPRGAPGRA